MCIFLFYNPIKTFANCSYGSAYFVDSKSNNKYLKILNEYYSDFESQKICTNTENKYSDLLLFYYDYLHLNKNFAKNLGIKPKSWGETIKSKISFMPF